MNFYHYATHFTHFRNCYCKKADLNDLHFKLVYNQMYYTKFHCCYILEKECTDMHKYNKVWLTWQYKHLPFCVCLHVCVRRHPETAVAGLQKTQSHSELRESPHTLPPEEMRHTRSDCVHAIQTDSSLRKRPKHHFTSVNTQ